MREWGDGSEDLEFQPSGWRIQLTGKVGQSALLTAILYGALGAFGVTLTIPATIVGALIPTIFDIERITLSPREEVIAHFVLRGYDGLETERGWYDALPAEVREELTHLDFVDVLDSVIRAGRARREGGEVQIFRSGTGRFAVSIE